MRKGNENFTKCKVYQNLFQPNYKIQQAVSTNLHRVRTIILPKPVLLSPLLSIFSHFQISKFLPPTDISRNFVSSFRFDTKFFSPKILNIGIRNRFAKYSSYLVGLIPICSDHEKFYFEKPTKMDKVWNDHEMVKQTQANDNWEFHLAKEKQINRAFEKHYKIEYSDPIVD